MGSPHLEHASARSVQIKGDFVCCASPAAGIIELTLDFRIYQRHQTDPMSLPLPCTERLPDLRSHALPGRFAAGIRIAFSSVRWAYTYPGLRGWVWLGVALNVFVYFGVLFVGWDAISDLAPALGPAPENQDAGWLRTLASMWQGVVQFLLLTLWVLLSMYLSLALCNVLWSPLFDLLSERTEQRLIGSLTSASGTSWLRLVGDALRELRVQLSLLLVYLPVTAGILLLGFIPVVGPVIAPLATWMWTSFWVALTFTAQSAARHRLGVRARLGFLLRHLPETLGFGALQSLVPFLFVPWMAPALVVGGTRLYLQLAIWDRVPSTLTDARKQALRRVS